MSPARVISISREKSGYTVLLHAQNMHRVSYGELCPKSSLQYIILFITLKVWPLQSLLRQIQALGHRV